MRFSLVATALIIACAICGCGSSQPQATTSSPTETVGPVTDSGPFQSPDFSQPSRLHLIADGGSQVNIGDPEDTFKAAFPRSAAKATSLHDQLPTGADPRHWEAKGWYLDNASRGVGALYYDNRIALAMSQFDSVEDSDVKKEVDQYVDAFGVAQTLDGQRVQYWFWQRGTVILMICAFKNDRNELDLTTALGDSGVMGRLHMSPSTAIDDLRAVERLYGMPSQASNIAAKTQ